MRTVLLVLNAYHGDVVTIQPLARKAVRRQLTGRRLLDTNVPDLKQCVRAIAGGGTIIRSPAEFTRTVSRLQPRQRGPSGPTDTRRSYEALRQVMNTRSPRFLAEQARRMTYRLSDPTKAARVGQPDEPDPDDPVTPSRSPPPPIPVAPREPHRPSHLRAGA